MNFELHKKQEPCYNRPPYRDGKKKTVIKSYSISQESFYIIIFGVPSYNLKEKIKNQCKEFGDVEKFFQVTNHANIERFTEAFAIKYSNVYESRYAKRKLDDLSFYGSILHVVFAPELESVAECRLKLHSKRCQVKNQLKKQEKFEIPVISHDASTNYCKPGTSSTFEIPTSSITKKMKTTNEFIKQTMQSDYRNSNSITLTASHNTTLYNVVPNLVPTKVIQNLKRKTENFSTDNVNYIKQKF